MIQINYDIEMPTSCQECPLKDWEFYYCHGLVEYKSIESNDIYQSEISRPQWCPLIEVKNVSQRNN